MTSSFFDDDKSERFVSVTTIETRNKINRGIHGIHSLKCYNTRKDVTSVLSVNVISDVNLNDTHSENTLAYTSIIQHIYK